MAGRQMKIGILALANLMLAVAGAEIAHAATDIEFLEGTCQKLVIASHDVAGCDGKLVNINKDDGSSGFYYSTPDGTTLTFSGQGSAQVKVNPDEVVQPVNLVIVRMKTGSPSSMSATGNCRYTNPMKGKAIVNCAATTSHGHFEGDFTTNGQPPLSGP